MVTKYEKRRDSELTLEVDSVVHVLRQYETGWAAGVLFSNKKGFFPLSCVTPIIPTRVLSQSLVKSSSQGSYSEKHTSIGSIPFPSPINPSYLDNPYDVLSRYNP